MGSFSSALSGLNAASVDLSVISNDLANMNTVGLQIQRRQFSGPVLPAGRQQRQRQSREVGSGVTIGSISSNFTEGTISETGVPTDVAIDGQGFSWSTMAANRNSRAPEISPSPQAASCWPATAAR